MGILALVAMGFLVACGRKYSSSSNGLVVVPSRDSAVMQTFSLNLNDGAITQINNAAGPPTPGSPSAVVLDPGGKFAYVIVTQNSQITDSFTGIAVFPIGSDGKLGTAAKFPLNGMNGTFNGVNETVPVVPKALAIDSAGKFLFVANSVTTDASNVAVPGSVSVLAVSNGTLNEVTDANSLLSSPFPVPLGPDGPADLTALAVSPTIFPSQFSTCSPTGAPTSENLYVTDGVNQKVWEFLVSSTGALVSPAGDSSVLGFTTGAVPSGIAVDVCNRFVYVANGQDNNISAYTICSAVIVGTCSLADGSLVAVSGSPFPAAINPGPMTENPFGNFLYVVNRGSGNVSTFKISPVSGSLTELTLATIATGSKPVAIAVRGDDAWLFVANSASANVSQYAITPATGQLTPQTPFITDGSPLGVAVK